MSALSSFSVASEAIGCHVFALFLHFTLTCCLIWTRIDSIQVTLAYSDDHEYQVINTQYMTMIVFGICSLVVRLLFLIIFPIRVNMALIISTCSDYLAVFFLCWIILDGLSWYSYAYILVFCVFIPLLFSVFQIILVTQKNVWLPWKHSLPWYIRLYYYFKKDD